jgi:uncharacterized membrane protein
MLTVNGAKGYKMKDSLQKISEETMLTLMDAKQKLRRKGKKVSFKQLIAEAVAKVYGK